MYEENTRQVIFDMTLDSTNPMLEAWQRIDAQASILMQHGIGLMTSGETNSAVDALSCFDSAFELRRQLPVETVPCFAYGLAACWLNRAETWMRLREQDASHGVATLHAFDQAIELLRKLPLDEDPKYPKRLAIAYQNRGLALQRKDHSDIMEISKAFGDALAILEQPYSELIPDRDYLLGTVHLNLANAYCLRLEVEHATTAQDAALRAIELVSGSERDDAEAAEVGLKGRHIFCKTVAPDLSGAIANRGLQFDKVHQATNMVEDGLDLVLSWEKKGVIRFRSIADDLFGFGALVYEKYQPQFLKEFLAEHLDPDGSSVNYVSEKTRRTAEEALVRANRLMERLRSKRFTIRWPRFDAANEPGERDDDAV